MTINLDALVPKLVALHPEGVDRNHDPARKVDVIVVALHPEGVDRNFGKHLTVAGAQPSPSTRRAWIEIGEG